MDLTVLWHDLECGAYRADLPLWLELAGQAGGPVLDLGAGTGRVALHLARAGHEVWAVDHDASLLAELRARAGALPVVPVLSDVRDLALGRTFALVLAPMQTVQLLGGPEGRSRALVAVRAHLASGGLFAAALAEAVERFEAGEAVTPPAPDEREVEGTLYSSRPVAVRDDRDGYVLERERRVVPAGGGGRVEVDAVRLDHVDVATLAREAAAAGLHPEPPAHIPPTADHVGSRVVMLRG